MNKQASKMKNVAYDALHTIGRSDLPDEVKHFVFVVAAAFYNWDEQSAHPSMGRIAQYMGCSIRHARDLRKEATRLGVLVCNQSKGGPKQTNKYRLCIDKLTPMTEQECERREYPKPLPNPAHHAGLPNENPERHDHKPGTACSATRHAIPPNPAPRADEQQREQPNEQPTTDSAAVAVLRGLGLEEALLRHHNATPERLAWAASEAAKKGNPAGWAATCIREGWAVPAPATGLHTNGTQRAGGKAAAARERIAAWKPEHRASLLVAARSEYRNLAGEPDDAASIIGAMARMLDGGKWKPPDSG